MNVQDILLVLLCFSQATIFYSLVKLDNKITMLIETMGKNQEKSNEYLKVIAEQHGYR